ncbi:MAG: pyridoxal phosphate-dependent decarboxylase family protein, partial [Acidobacteriota bacterium]
MGTRWDDARGESVGTADLLGGTYDLAVGYLHDLPARRVVPHISAEELRSALGGPMPEEGTDPVDTIRSLSSAVEPGLVASSGPRYFGFVIGGSLPVAIAADWLTSTWDQNAGLHVAAPAASVVEQVAATWLLDIFGLPATASVGFVTGCQMANFTALAAARNAVLSRLGWDVEQGGLREAPPVDVIVGAEAHVTILSSLRMLGFGSRNVRVVETDGQGRMKAEGLGRVLDGIRGASIVCAQAGNVNTGSFDPLSQIA